MPSKLNNIALGIDLGGTKILAAVINAEGKILATDRADTPASEGEAVVVNAMVESAGRAVLMAGISTKDFAAGVGVPGLSNPETGILYTSPNLPYLKDVPIVDMLEKRLGVKPFLINDANAAALGELYFGAGRGMRNLVYITVSTGIGGGIIVNGEIYAGSGGMAGEIGHMTIDDNGPPCKCGSRGCLEVMASGTALAVEAVNRIIGGARTSILEYAGGEIGNVGGRAIEMAARSGDSLAIELINRNAYYLGIGLANLINIFNPEAIIIGGGLSNIGDLLLEPAREEAGRRAFRKPYKQVRILPAALGHNSGVMGAAAFAFKKMREQIKG